MTYFTDVNKLVTTLQPTSMASRQQMAKLRADVAARRRSGASLASIREMGNEQRCRSDSAELSATDSAELSLDTSLDTSRPGERIAPSVSPRGEQSSSTSTTLTTATSAAASPSLATVVAAAAASDASRYHVDAALAVSSEDNTADALARRMLKQQRDFAERGRRAEVYVQLMLAGAIALVSIVAFAVHGLHTHGLLRLAHDHAVLSIFGFACPLLGFGASKMIQPDLSPSLLSSRLTSVFLALVGIFLSLLLALVASVVRSVVLSSALNLALAAVATAAGWSMLYIASPTTVGTLTTSELATREFDGSAWQQQRRRRRSSGELSTSRQLSTTGSTGSSHTKQRRRSRSGSGAGVAGLALPDALPLGASPTGGGSTNGTKGNNLALLNELDAPGAMPDADAAKFVDASSSEWFSSHGGGGGGGGGGRGGSTALAATATATETETDDDDSDCAVLFAPLPPPGVYNKTTRRQCALLPSVMAVAETILAEVALPAVVCDSKSPFVLLAANDAWLDATVLTKGDVLGRTHSVIQGPLTERAQIDVILKATAAKTPKFSVRLINYTSVGRPFENILTVHRCHRGGAHGTTCVVRDMLLAVSQIRYLDDQEVKAAEEQCGGMYNS